MSELLVFFLTFLFLSVPFIIAFVVYYKKWESASSVTCTCPVCTASSCPASTPCTASALIQRGVTQPVTGTDYPGNDLGPFPAGDANTCLLVASQNPKATGALYYPISSSPSANGYCYPKSTPVTSKNPSPLAGIVSYWFTS